jgi:hypothetical protein
MLIAMNPPRMSDLFGLARALHDMQAATEDATKASPLDESAPVALDDAPTNETPLPAPEATP